MLAWGLSLLMIGTSHSILTGEISLGYDEATIVGTMNAKGSGRLEASCSEGYSQ
jgi:hypothetical protein